MAKTDDDTPPSRQVFEEYCGYTGLHGFHFFTRPFVIRRIIWAILLLLGVALFGFSLKTGITKLTDYKTTIRREIDYSNKLKFPAFTFCNINMMKKSKILGTHSQYFLDQLDAFDSKIDHDQRDINASFNIEKAVRVNGHTAKDMVKACFWNSQDCSYQNFTTFVSQNNGLCHTFNSGKDGNPILWTKSNEKDKSLILIIDVQPSEYYGPFSYLSTGIQAIVHNQENQPTVVRDYGIDLMPGLTTSLLLTRQKIISLPSPFKSACGTRKLKSVKTYSKEACLYECYTRFIIQRYGCRFLGMPVLAEFNRSNYCTPKEIKESDENTHNEKNDSSFDPLLMCDCPTKCERFEYKVQLNTAYFPSESYIRKILSVEHFEGVNVSELSQGNISQIKNVVRQELMIVKVYFKDLNTEVIEENISYDYHDLISDIGGVLGLFLGCSLLTFFEFLDFIVMLFAATCKSSTQSKDKKEENKEKIKELSLEGPYSKVNDGTQEISTL